MDYRHKPPPSSAFRPLALMHFLSAPPMHFYSGVDTMSATAEALRAICDLGLSDLEVIEPPRGHRKD